MKTLRSLSLMRVVVLALAVVAAAPAVAHAQNVEGKFTLSRETHWGPAVLTPGDYEFRIDSVASPAHILVRKSTGDLAAMVVSMSVASGKPAGNSQLNLVDRGNDVFVSSLYLKDPGTELYFAVPKATALPQTAGMQPPSMSGAGK